MGARLCPKCGKFAMVFKPGYLNQKDAFVCSSCQEVVLAEEAGIAMTEDNLNRFPSGLDNQQPTSGLQDFLERKKQ